MSHAAIAPKQRLPSTGRVALTIVVAMIETLLFSGVSYGVVSLVPMLQARGIYSQPCGNSSSTIGNVSTNVSALSCSSVEEQVTLAFTVTQVVTPFGNLLSGTMLDRLGFRAVKGTATLLFSLGCLCFTLVQPGLDWLIFPGTMMLGISGIQVMISNLQLAPMVRLPFVIASMLSGLFDACTMVTSTLVILTNNGINSYAAFGVYTGLGAATIALTIVIYPGKHNLMQFESEQEINGSIQQHEQEQRRGKVQQQQQRETVTAVDEHQEEVRGSLAQQLLSTDFILMIVWMVCNNLRLNYFFGSLNAYVDVITGDKKQVEYYSTLFGYFFLTSPLISLVPGALLDLQKRLIPSLRQNTHRAYKLNTVTTLSMTALLGVLSSLMLLRNGADMLIPAFVSISVYRSFLFSTLGNYCISVFSPEYFGIVYTSIICTAAPFMFLTVPITNWLKDSKNPDPINCILAGLSVVSLVHPLTLLLRNLRRTKVKQMQPSVVD